MRDAYIITQQTRDLWSAFGEHPTYTIAEWRLCLVDGETKLGYWDWVTESILDEYDPRMADIHWENVRMRCAPALETLERLSSAKLRTKTRIRRAAIRGSTA